MINLPKDLYARLAISAHKLKNPQKQEPRYKMSPQKEQFFKEIINEQLANDTSLGMKPVPLVSKESDYDTVEKIKYRKQVQELKEELQNLEKIFKQLKDKEKDVESLLKLHRKIDSLKKVIEEKSAI